MSEVTPTFPVLASGPTQEVWVIRRPRPKWWLYVLFLLLTMFSTTVVGARMEFNFLHRQPVFSLNDDTISLFPALWAIEKPANLLLGLPFSLTLMFILFAHEMGHYLYARHYRVYATPPFFVPFPSLIGTLGAFIRIKSPIPSRAALFDIGDRRADCGIYSGMRRVGCRAIVIASSNRFDRFGFSTWLPVGFLFRPPSAGHARAALLALAASDCRGGVGGNVRDCAQSPAGRPTGWRAHPAFDFTAPASLVHGFDRAGDGAAREISLDGVVPVGGAAGHDR